MIVSKKSTLQMDEGFKTTLPMGVDHLQVTRNMDTTSLATTFPFTSSELTMDTGILYGINEHNESLVIFDRFRMESYNMLILAKSGAGKSYTVKLEILRQLMFDTEVIVLDPEQEYEDLCEMVGGEYINFTFGSEAKINPFDLSQVYEEGQNELGQKILSLHGLLKVMLGEMTAEQDALLDRALIATYKAKGITPDPATQKNPSPLMEDLYKTIIGMESEEADDIAARLEKFITGSFRGIFDQASNINIKNEFTVFSVKEMEDELRPIAMYVILDFIWTKVKKDFRKRLLIIDEAWYFMQHPDSGRFIYSMAKRARKYYLGITTITQDVEDFLHNDFGKAIVSNASIKFLMKQSSASIPALAEAFYLSEGERQLLVSADVGEGVFFAGQNHVALRVVASPEEHEVITTDPREIEQKMKKKAVLLTLICLFFLISIPSFSLTTEKKPDSKALTSTVETTQGAYLAGEFEAIANPQPMRNNSILTTVINLILSMLFVIGLIYIVMLAIKYFYVRASIPLKSEGVIRVLAKEHLDSKRIVYVIEFADRVILAAAGENITPLSEITDPETVAKIKENADEYISKYRMKSESRFAQEIKSAYLKQGKKIASAGNETIKKIKEKFEKK